MTKNKFLLRLLLLGWGFAFCCTSAGAAPIDLLGTTGNFVLLGLNGGSLSINSATSITGNVGYSANIVVPSAQKVDRFTGRVFVDTSTVAAFDHACVSKTFSPSLGIVTGGVADTVLKQANDDALALRIKLNNFYVSGPVTSLGTVSKNQSFSGNGGINLFDVTWAFNSNTLILYGNANDWFIFRSTGTGNKWADSQTILIGVDPNHVLFYFTRTGTDFTVNKATTVFQGTIFAPYGSVIYHNPATFDGRIIADDITVHSDFNIAASPVSQGPEPSPMPQGPEPD